MTVTPRRPFIWQDEMTEVREAFRRVARVKQSSFSGFSLWDADSPTAETLSRNRLRRRRSQFAFELRHLNYKEPPFEALTHLHNIRGMCSRIQRQVCMYPSTFVGAKWLIDAVSNCAFHGCKHCILRPQHCQTTSKQFPFLQVSCLQQAQYIVLSLATFQRSWWTLTLWSHFFVLTTMHVHFTSQHTSTAKLNYFKSIPLTASILYSTGKIYSVVSSKLQWVTLKTCICCHTNVYRVYIWDSLKSFIASHMISTCTVQTV